MTTPTSNQAGSSYQSRGSPTIDRYGRDLSDQLTGAARSAGTASTGITKFNEILGNTGRILRHALIPLSGVLVGLTSIGAGLLKTAQSAGYTSEAFRQVNRDMYRAKLALSRIVVDAVVPLLQVIVKLINVFNSLPKGFKVTTLAIFLFAVGIATALAPILLLLGYTIPLIITLNKWGLAAKLASIGNLALTVSTAPLNAATLALTLKNWLLIKSHLVLHGVTNSTIVIQLYLALSTLRYSVTTGIAAIANGILAASFVALKLAMGPVGLALVAIGLAVYSLTKAWRSWQSSTDSQTSSIGKTLRLWSQSSITAPGSLLLPLPEQPKEDPWWRNKDWWLGDTASIVTNEVGAFFKGFAEKFVEDLDTIFKATKLNIVWDALKEGLSPVIENIKETVTETASNIKSWWDNNINVIDWSMFLWGNLKTILAAVKDWVQLNAGQAKTWWDENNKVIGWSMFLWGNLKTVSAAVKDWVQLIARQAKIWWDENNKVIGWSMFLWGNLKTISAAVKDWVQLNAGQAKTWWDENNKVIGWSMFLWGNLKTISAAVKDWVQLNAGQAKIWWDENVNFISWALFMWNNLKSISTAVKEWIQLNAREAKIWWDENITPIEWAFFLWSNLKALSLAVKEWIQLNAKQAKTWWDENINPVDWGKFLWGNARSVWSTVKTWLSDRIRNLNPFSSSSSSSSSNPSTAYNYKPSSSQSTGTGAHNLSIRPPTPVSNIYNVRQTIDGTGKPEEVADKAVDKIREAIDSGRFDGRLQWV